MRSLYQSLFAMLPLVCWALFAVVTDANAQGFTASAPDMRGLQQHSCKEPAMELKAELIRLRQEISQVIACNRDGQVLQDGNCVNAVTLDHNYVDDYQGEPDRRDGLSFGGGAYGLVGGADGLARCVRVCRYDGVDYEDGDVITLYEQSSTCGAPCVERTFTCSGSSFSPSIPAEAHATAGSCPAGPCAGCTDPLTGADIDDGDGVMAYNPVRACGDPCTSATITCSDGSMSSPPWGGGVTDTCPDEPADCDDCLHPITGDPVAEGDDITLYREASACGSCDEDTFTCSAGSFGSTTGYTHDDETTCLEDAACPPGCDVYVGSAYQTTISDGEDITYFRPSSGVTSCNTCDDQLTQTCAGGARIDFGSSYDPSIVSWSACEAANPCPGDCRINWSDGGTENVPHNDSVQAYASGSVSFGNTCSSETRDCNDGTLSGSNTYKNCSSGAAPTCTHNGNQYDIGETITLFKASPNCGIDKCGGSGNFTCQSSGNFTPDDPAKTMSVYNLPSYQACKDASFACDCTINWSDGGTENVPHNDSVQAYASGSVSFGNTCSSETRDCNDGTLSGSNTYKNCSSGAAPTCTHNGNQYDIGETITLFKASPNCGIDKCGGSGNFTCQSSGNFTPDDPAKTMSVYNLPSYQACKDASFACDCTINWSDGGTENVLHNDSVQAYASGSVPYNQSCSSQTRDCNDGTLSGSNTYQSCTPEAPAPSGLTWQRLPNTYGYSPDLILDHSLELGMDVFNSCNAVHAQHQLPSNFITNCTPGGACSNQGVICVYNQRSCEFTSPGPGTAQVFDQYICTD